MKFTGEIGLPVPGATGHGLILPTGQAADQENWVPVTVEFSTMGEEAAPEQMDCPGRHDITGVGLTGKVKPADGPEQPFAWGVIR